jgi:hypothetical protein
MSRAISICEEYCKSVRESRGTITVAVEGKYFTELYTRLMLLGYCCSSIMSSETSETHLARFVPSSPDSDIFGDWMHEDIDDGADDWKYSDD